MKKLYNNYDYETINLLNDYIKNDKLYIDIWFGLDYGEVSYASQPEYGEEELRSLFDMAQDNSIELYKYDPYDGGIYTVDHKEVWYDLYDYLDGYYIDDDYEGELREMFDTVKSNVESMESNK